MLKVHLTFLRICYTTSGGSYKSLNGNGIPNLRVLKNIKVLQHNNNFHDYMTSSKILGNSVVYVPSSTISVYVLR